MKSRLFGVVVAPLALVFPLFNRTGACLANPARVTRPVFAKRLIAGLALWGFTSIAFAVPVTVTQVFSGVAWDDYGVASGLGYNQNVTGDWIFKGVVDTAATNEYAYPSSGAQYAATVTLTQASLGLFDAPILNMQYLYFYSGQLGFVSNTLSAIPWTATKYPSGTFPSFAAFPASPGTVMPTSTDPGNGFAPQWDGFLFASGARLYGWGHATTSTVSFISVSSVPEPASVLLLGTGLIGLIGLARRRRAA